MELKTELTLKDKLLSWKRWIGVAMIVFPIILEAMTGALSWPVAVITAVIAASATILGLAKEDAARLQAAGIAIAAAITKKDSEPEYEIEVEDDDGEWEDEDDEYDAADEDTDPEE